MDNHEGHIKLWDELARTGGGSKRYAFRRVFGACAIPPLDDCFACEECNERGDTRYCTKCPLPNADSGCLGGLFDDWLCADSVDERKRLAAIIRDLPWREK